MMVRISIRRYYALAAAAALLKYVEYIQHVVYAPKSMRIEFQGSPNTTMIGRDQLTTPDNINDITNDRITIITVIINVRCTDIESAHSLELIVSQSKHSVVSLLGTMDRCLTPMGRRLLRASILQPSCDERLIIDRQSCVAELIADRSLCVSLQVSRTILE